MVDRAPRRATGRGRRAPERGRRRGRREGVRRRIVRELKLERFCIQLCHWICFLRCRRFCFIVCPPIFDHPWFTHVGDFDITGDFNAGRAHEQAAGGHGGPGFGFFDCLRAARLLPEDVAGHPGRSRWRTGSCSEKGRNADADHRRLRLRGARREPLHHSGTRTGPASSRRCSPSAFAATNPSPDPTPFPGQRRRWDRRPIHYIVPDAQRLDPGRPERPRRRLQRAGSWGSRRRVAFPGGNPAPGVARRERRAGRRAEERERRGDHLRGDASEPDRRRGRARLHEPAREDPHQQLERGHAARHAPVPPARQHVVLAAQLGSRHRVHDRPRAHGGVGDRDDHRSDGRRRHRSSRAASGRGAVRARTTTTSRRWPTCSYAITLTSRRSLTNGLTDDSGKTIQKTFCIGARRTPPR